LARLVIEYVFLVIKFIQSPRSRK